MNLAEYLRWRGNKSKVLSLSHAEAKLLGIAYPLPKDWAQNSHCKLLSGDLVSQLKEACAKGLTRPVAKLSRPGRAIRGARALWGDSVNRSPDITTASDAESASEKCQ